MNREEILSKSRAENKSEDERERRLRTYASIPTLIALFFSCIVLSVLELLFLDTNIIMESSGLMVAFAGLVQNCYLLIAIKKKFYSITLIIWVVLTILAIKGFTGSFLAMVK